MDQELLKLGLLDLVDFLCIQNIRVIPIPHKHADHMYKKFQDSNLASGNGISKVYILSGNTKDRFIELLNDSGEKNVSLYLIVVPENYHANLENSAQHLQFAFKFNKKQDYHILLNCTNEIVITTTQFNTLKNAVINNDMAATLNSNISSERGVTTVNTKRINMDFSDKIYKKTTGPLYFYPTIRTLNIFQIEDIDKENVAQLFSFGLMISNEEITEGIGDPYRTFSATAVVNDRYRNCPPLVCP